MLKENSNIDIRQQIINVCKKLSQQGFVQSTAGNISARTKNNTILITPSGWHKGDLEVHHLVEIDLQGKHISGDAKPSSESRMHITVYQARPDINAVIHAHPPFCTTWAACGKPLPSPNLPEVIGTLGEIAFIEYATPGSTLLSNALTPYLSGHTAFLLCNHGALTIGQNVEAAMHHMQTFELFSQVALQAKSLGALNPLPNHEIEYIKEICKSYGR